MKFLKQSARNQPKISLILLDWSVRESFHLLHYLEKQTLDRDLFEVIIIEYYSRESAALTPFLSQVDAWVLLEMPASCYYHKHLMYNVGIAYARGEIIVICDSDAMVKPTFLQAIASHFETSPDTVLHLDQFRSHRRDFYPFNYPGFESVMGEGCVNYLNGQTTGLACEKDPLHHRNYGACFCALRTDLIAMGGSDEHVDYVGYICGPYDLTFRLINFGRKEVWHPSEFLYHTWHPGQAGEDNYCGPHDGRHSSTTSLTAFITGRIAPHVENKAIRQLRLGQRFCVDELIHPATMEMVKPAFLKSKKVDVYSEKTYADFLFKGFLIRKEAEYYFAQPLVAALQRQQRVFQAASLKLMKDIIANDMRGFYLIESMIFLITSFYQTRDGLRSQKEKRLQSKRAVTSGEKGAYIKKIKKSLYLLSQLKDEIRWLSRSSQDLIVNLWLLKKEGAVAIQLWVYSHREARIVNLLRFLKLLPDCQLVQLSQTEAVRQQLMATLRLSEKLIISRELYLRFPSLLSAELIKNRANMMAI